MENTSAPQDQMPHSKNLIATVTHIDDRIQEPLKETLRLLVETYPLYITGFNNNLSVVIDGDMVANAVYDPLIPTFGYNERFGKSIENAFAKLIEKHISDGVTFDVMFIEPDTLYKNVISAWHCKNMRAARLETSSSQRDLRIHPIDVREPSASTPKVVVKFACDVERGHNVVMQAKDLLATINLQSANSYQRPTFE